uniref:Ribosomal RNA adenine methylase transferase N-terminal domain-containing protein n=1 Tax=Fervidicoccus fontis TaxID=683846 RepID=A0A7J3ZJQ0_9CREN
MSAWLEFTREVFSSKKSLLSFTLAALSHYGIRASRKRGQNFSVSPRYLEAFYRKLVEWSPQAVLEVGTGIGALAYYVALRGREWQVVTIENDRRIYSASVELAGGLDNIAFVLADALEVIETARFDTVFSSTPYSITMPLLLGIVRNNSVKRSVLGVQREVADRIVAEPGTRDYGRLTVAVALHFSVERLGDFRPQDFFPPPEVHTTLIALERKREYSRTWGPLLEELTGCIFSSRNKRAKRVVACCLERLGVSEERARTIAEESIRGEGMRARELSPQSIQEMLLKALSRG